MPYHANYKVMVGRKDVNQLIGNAGLGISGAYEPVTYTVDWADGEYVNEIRAKSLCESIKSAINSETTMDCSRVELIRFWID